MLRPLIVMTAALFASAAMAQDPALDAWQRQHLYDPRSVVPESNMPAFPWLFENRIDHTSTESKLETLQTLGVPYTDEQVAGAADEVRGKFEIEALVAYLQQLGTVISDKR